MKSQWTPHYNSPFVLKNTPSVNPVSRRGVYRVSVNVLPHLSVKSTYMYECAVPAGGDGSS